MKRKPVYIMPANPGATDRVIEERFAQFNEIVDCEGLNAARTQVVSELTAGALWLDRIYGTKGAYEFLQTLCDKLIAPVLNEA